MTKGLTIASFNNTANPNNTVPPIFPEWSDNEVNEENWDGLFSKSKSFSAYNEDLIGRFKDPHVIRLPPSLSYREWKRPAEIFSNASLVIYKDKQECPDLVSDNIHILKSEFMRNFISSIETLWFLGNSTNFLWEFLSSSFSTESSCPWKPWLHIYSKCKAGKGVHHNPQPNKTGKYIVRLFWLGTWRKIFIDDTLPVDKNGNINLVIIKTNQPTSETRQSKTTTQYIPETVEMWPFLLCKALLKLACLTWYGDQELLDFDIIQCLTGWIPNKTFTKYLSPNESWDFCMKHTDRYCWPEEQQPQNKEEKKNKFILLGCYENNSSDSISSFNVGSKWTHHFLINQTRDKPLIKPSKASEYPLWKSYRWLDWAAKEGLIPPTESPIPVKSLGIVDSFRKIYKPNKEEQSSIDHEQKTSANAELSKFRSNEVKQRTPKKVSMHILDRQLWLDYSEMLENIKSFIVYFKPSGFASKIKVSDAQPQINLTKKNNEPFTSGWKDVIYPMDLTKVKNEPLFIFSDSLHSRTLVLNLSQAGYTKELSMIPVNEISGNDEQRSISADDSECGLCLTTLLERYKLNKEKLKEVKHEQQKEDIFYVPNHPRVNSHIVVTKFLWNSERRDDYLTDLRTYGSTAAVLNLKPGRYVLRLYIKSTSPYSLLVISDDTIGVSNLYDVMYLMEEEPYLLKKFCSDISQNFAKLVQSFGTANFETNLRNFYSSCRPEVELSKKNRNSIYSAFLDKLLDTVSRVLGPDKEYHLKILFRQWQRPLSKMSSTTSLLFCYHVDEQDKELVNELQNAAQKIQSVFRGFHERYLLKCHQPSHKQYKKTVESLNVINGEIFSETSNMLPTVFRKFFKQESMVDIVRFYPFCDHIDNTVSMTEVSESNLRSASTGWIFICRQTFYVEEPVLMKVNLFCDLPVYFIRAYNNYSKVELKHYNHYLPVNLYTPNANGYTVTCYGYMDQLQAYNYKLVFTSEKHPNKSLVKIVSSQINTDGLIGNYIPNVENIITRGIFCSFNEFTVATIRLTTSYKKAKINLKIIDNTGHVCREAMNQGEVIIPAVIIPLETIYAQESRESRKLPSKKSKSPKRQKRSMDMQSITLGQDYYIIEATVLDNSWPLTSAEWKTVARIKSEIGFGSKNSSSSKNATRKTTNFFDPPYWMLQVITNVDGTSILQKDRKREEEILNMKMSWFQGFPKRYEKGQELRQIFLQNNLVPNTKQITNPSTRSLDPKVFEAKLLAPFDMHQYAVADDSEQPKEVVWKNQENLHDETFKEQEAIESFQHQVEIMREELNGVINTQKEMSNIYNTWFEGCRKESAEMLADAASLRRNYLRNHCEEVNGGPLKKHKKPTSQIRTK